MQKTDVFIFMGQSNMAGRGESQFAPSCPENAGMEFRSISSPNSLFPIHEPFGIDENVEGNINDSHKKCGGMVSSVVKEYHELTGRKVIAVSASEGGTTTDQWLKRMINDACIRLTKTFSYLIENQIPYEHVFCIWCQGESDADFGISEAKYNENFLQIWNQIHTSGAQECFLIQIGHFNYLKNSNGKNEITGDELDQRYEIIRIAQQHLCETESNIHFASTFKTHLADMKDSYHYHQKAYNEVGIEVANSIATWVQNNPFSR